MLQSYSATDKDIPDGISDISQEICGFYRLKHTAFNRNRVPGVSLEIWFDTVYDILLVTGTWGTSDKGKSQHIKSLYMFLPGEPYSRIPGYFWEITKARNLTIGQNKADFLHCSEGSQYTSSSHSF